MQQFSFIANLVHSDFKRRYLGTYFGAFWAFAAPLSTIAVLLFVFNVGFRVGPTNGISFDLWLTTGLLVWFYFADGVTSGANSIVEYSFLVKKIRFPVAVLPAIKILSALYAHLINMMLLFCLFLYRGHLPDIVWIQLPYYLFALMILMLALATISSVIQVFFRDYQGVLNVLMQIGLWGTPILWDANVIPDRYAALIYLNPVNYIVQGYRDTMLHGAWCFEHPGQMGYFWLLTLSLLGVSAILFRRAQRDFADVL